MIEQRIKYEYPRDLDLSPGSALHESVKAEILLRARESNTIIKNRHSDWRKIDQTLTAFLPADADEDAYRSDNEELQIVIPASRATLETALTYWLSTLDFPFFYYDGSGPEDTLGARMLQLVIGNQAHRKKMILALHTMHRDALSYGFGAVNVRWTVEKAFRTLRRDVGYFSEMDGEFIVTEPAGTRQERVIYEGNILDAIDPYHYLPDPNYPVERVNDGEFVGFVSTTSRNALLTLERNNPEFYFNATHLDRINQRSSLKLYDNTGRPTTFAGNQEINRQLGTTPIDVIWMQIDLVPKEWGLGDEEYPEKWMFGLAGDEVLIQANPMGLDHNHFTIAVDAPNSDGHSALPIGEMEVEYGLQYAVDFLWNSHMANLRKAVNLMLIVDPFLVNINDFKRGRSGFIARMRRSQFGRGTARDAVHQIPINDITRANIGDIQFLMDIMSRTSGVTDPIQGIMRSGGERRSATEARGTMQSALSRLAKGVRISGSQALQDIAYLLAEHTIQLLSNETYVRSIGETEDQMLADYQVGKGRYRVDPSLLDVNFDVLPSDGTLPGGNGDPQVWTQLFQTIASQETLAQTFDIPRIFTHIARMMGAKNVQNFINNARPVVQSDEEVAKQVQNGNLVRPEELNSNLEEI